MRNKIRLSFVGDIMCQRELISSLRKNHAAYDEVFKDVKFLFAESDYVIGNLETPIAGEALRLTNDATIFNSPLEFARAVKNVGIDFVSTANNHCLDRGEVGLDKTLEALDSVGLSHTGTYRSKEEYEQIFIKDFYGFKVAFVASTYGTNSESGTPLIPSDRLWKIDLTRAQNAIRRDFRQQVRHCIGRILPTTVKSVVSTITAAVSGDTLRPPLYIVDNVELPLSVDDLKLQSRFLRKISKAKMEADLVVAIPHAGGQYNPGPGSYQKKIIADIVDAGADLVVSGHSHTPLRTELLPTGKFIAYSLGNFAFTPGVGWYLDNVLADYGIVLHIDVDTNGRKIESAEFSVVKSIVGNDGITRIVPVDKLINKLHDSRNKERILMENEVVVNRFRGCAECVVPATSYTISLR